MSIPLYVHQMLEEQESRKRSELNALEDGARRESHHDELWTKDNDHNFGADSIPSITIHSSFQRIPLSQQYDFPGKSPEVHLEPKNSNSVSSQSQNEQKKNWIWWVYGSRTLPFQTRGLVIPIGDGAFQIVLDDSEADVTFETIMEVEEYQPEWIDEVIRNEES